MAPWSSITGVTGLFNAMIAPLADNFHLSGVLWYQGESNTGHAHNYAELLTSMIADWRQHLGASLPFIVVQLPEFGQLPSIPSDSGWARVRDAQQRVAKADALTGLAVTIGSADPSDLHPPNKRIVGARAAMVAVGLLRGNNVVTDGIVPSRVLLNDGEVTIQFSEEAWPLFVSGSATPMGFELCDKRRQCRYASARLDQNQIVLDASTIDTPAEVRHAWADAPLVNLHGAQDIPVSSFRLAVEDGSN
jgi:sialate O-acetylesterase